MSRADQNSGGGDGGLVHSPGPDPDYPEADFPGPGYEGPAGPSLSKPARSRSARSRAAQPRSHSQSRANGQPRSAGQFRSAGQSRSAGETRSDGQPQPGQDRPGPGRTQPGRPGNPGPDPHNAADPGGPEQAGEAAGPPTGQTRLERRRRLRRQKRTSFLREFPVLIIIAFLLALLIKTFFVEAFWIPSASMERTLLINDRVLVNKLVYDFRDPRKGDIVVFNGDGTGFQNSEVPVAPPSNFVARILRDISSGLGLGAPNENDFIKRVIATGGDTVQCCDAKSRIMVNGTAINEPYLFEDNASKFGPVTVPKGDLWVMGDHRGDSEDSRFNGPIPASKVVGRAFIRVWPVSRVGLLTPPNIYRAGPPTVAGGALAGCALLVPVAGFRRRRAARRGARPGRGGGVRLTGQPGQPGQPGRPAPRREGEPDADGP